MKSLMKNAVGVMSMLVLSGIAHAQGVPATTLPMEWTGLYGGLNGAAVFNHVTLESHHPGFTNIDGTCDTNNNFASFSPGAQLGYVFETNSNVVLGVEGDFDYNTSQKGSLTCRCPINPGVSDKFSFYNRVEGSVRGRIGYALNEYRLLPFFTVGGGIADVGLKYFDEIGDSYSTHNTQAGWLVGAGVEWKIASAWSMRAEYYYTGYCNVNMGITTLYGLTDPNGAARAGLYNNTLRLAVNYWF